MPRAPLALLALLLSAGAASAAPRRVGVLPFEGPRAAALRTAVIQALSADGRVTPIAAPRASDLPALAEARDLAALITGRAQAIRGRRARLTLTVLRADDGSADGRVTIETTARALPARVRRDAARRLAPLLARLMTTRPAPQPEPEPTPEPQPAPEPAPEPPPPPPPTVAVTTSVPPAPARPRPRVLDLAVGVRVLERRYHWVNPGTLLPRYHLSWAPAAAAAVELYPLAAHATGPLAHLGVTGSVTSLVGATSRWAGGRTYPTTAVAWSAGARLRLPLGPVQLGAGAAYGRERFTLGPASDGTPAPPVPGVDYHHLRAGAGARLQLGPVALLASAAYLHLLALGEVTAPDYFPDATGRGLEAAAGIAVSLPLALELRVGAEVRRYDLTLAPAPGALRVAEGAVDQNLGATAALAARF